MACLDSFTDGLMDPKCLTHLASQGMVQNNGSSSISEVRWCEGGDRVGVSLEAETYFAHGDKFQRVCTPATGSTFTAELIFAGVGDTTYVHPYAGVYLGPDGIPNVA